MQRAGRIALVAVGVALVGVALIAWDVHGQYPDQGPAWVAAGTLLSLAFLLAFSWPVLLVAGWIGVELFALGHVLLRRDTTWRRRLPWLAAIVALAPFFAAGAIVYVFHRKQLAVTPDAGAAG